MGNLIGRNFYDGRLKTSIRLEPELWDGLGEVCQREGWTRAEAVAAAQAIYPDRPRTSAMRTYLVVYFKKAATKAGHSEAGHGDA